MGKYERCVTERAAVNEGLYDMRVVDVPEKSWASDDAEDCCDDCGEPQSICGDLRPLFALSLSLCSRCYPKWEISVLPERDKEGGFYP